MDKATGFQPRGCGFETNYITNSFLLFFVLKIHNSHTQFRYQLVLFIHIYGWLKVAFGIFFLGKLAVGIF